MKVEIRPVKREEERREISRGETKGRRQGRGRRRKWKWCKLNNKKGKRKEVRGERSRRETKERRGQGRKGKEEAE